MSKKPLSHIYFDKNYNGYIRWLCTPKIRQQAQEIRKQSKQGYIKPSSGWETMDGVKHWSIGAGQNATCKECLLIFLEKQNKQQRKAILKLRIK